MSIVLPSKLNSLKDFREDDDTNISKYIAYQCAIGGKLKQYYKHMQALRNRKDENIGETNVKNAKELSLQIRNRPNKNGHKKEGGVGVDVNMNGKLMKVLKRNIF